MKNFIACTAAVATTLLVAPAMAGTIFTPSIELGAATDIVNCRLLNAGNKPVEDVTIEIRSSSGNVDVFNFLESIEPGQTASATDHTPGAVAYCRVDGKRVSKGKSKATLCALDSGGTPLACVTAP